MTTKNSVQVRKKLHIAEEENASDQSNLDHQEEIQCVGNVVNDAQLSWLTGIHVDSTFFYITWFIAFEPMGS